MTKLSVDHLQVSLVIDLLKESRVPTEQESGSHSFELSGGAEQVANAYFAIVAICHQTSPIGERRLEGKIGGIHKVGWDYLKERFLVNAAEDAHWMSPTYWRSVTPVELSSAFEDAEFGKTLNRVSERAFLLNNLGEVLNTAGFPSIWQAYSGFAGLIGGNSGFLEFLSTFEAYKDPVKKKSLFFLSIMKNELGWTVEDADKLLSPVDYHEIRGHLRIGTILINDLELRGKVESGLAITEPEDVEIRSTVQSVNDLISNGSGLSSSAIHYLFWNVFRNCCPRESFMTHCLTCGDRCGLPVQYKAMPSYQKRCIFAGFCSSADKSNKVVEPPYLGHYY